MPGPGSYRAFSSLSDQPTLSPQLDTFNNKMSLSSHLLLFYLHGLHRIHHFFLNLYMLIQDFLLSLVVLRHLLARLLQHLKYFFLSCDNLNSMR